MPFCLVLLGIERLCVCTSNGALKFYQVTQQGLETSNSNPQKTESAPKSPLPIELQEGKKTSVEEDNTDAAQGKSAGKMSAQCSFLLLDLH